MTLPRFLADLLAIALRGDAAGNLQLGLGAVAIGGLVVAAAAWAANGR